MCQAQPSESVLDCRQAVLGPCQTCARARQHHADEQRASSTARGYTPEWRRLRVDAFVRDGWTCVDCQWMPTLVEQYKRIGIEEGPSVAAVLEELRIRKLQGLRHLHGDHIETIETRPDLRLVLSNVATRCDACHARKTAREDGGFGRQAGRYHLYDA